MLATVLALYNSAGLTSPALILRKRRSHVAIREQAHDAAVGAHAHCGAGMRGSVARGWLCPYAPRKVISRAWSISAEAARCIWSVTAMALPVVLVSGARGAHDDWTHVAHSGGEPKPNPSGSAVFPKVGKSTRVCAYDRPGTTRMDSCLHPCGAADQGTGRAADLHALLSAAKEPGPYVLVAHSWGGLIARSTRAPTPMKWLALSFWTPPRSSCRTS